MQKILRAATIPTSLDVFCRGQLAELSQRYEVVALSSPGEALDRLGQREGVRTIAVPMAREMSPLADLRSLWRLTGVMRRERPQMVHSMTPKAGLLCMLAARIAGVPLRVHTFTGLLFPTARGWRRHLLRLTDRLTCACATHIIPEGEGVRRDLLEGGITRKPMRVLGHGNVRGIDLEHYSRTPDVAAEGRRIRLDAGIADSDVVFIFVGRLVADKGLAELIEAFATLSGRGVRLLLVGDEEPERDPLPEAVRAAIAADSRIVHAGWQEDVRPWLAAADVLVLPSYREGFPNSVIEAGAMGLPSVVTDINGAREIIRDGVNGLIVPPRDAAALGAAMSRMVSDPDARAQMAAKARPLVASRYEQGYVHRCLEEFYREIMPDDV